MTQDKVLEQLDKMSSKVSDQIRYIGYGLAGACFSLLISNSIFALYTVKEHRVLLVICAIFGCMAVFSDIAQYMMGYLNALKARDNGNKSNDFSYPDTDCTYKLRNAFFYLKLLFSLLGAIILIFLLITSAMRLSKSKEKENSALQYKDWSSKAMLVEKKYKDSSWYPLNLIDLNYVYTGYNSLRQPAITNEIIPLQVAGKLVLQRRIKVACKGMVSAEAVLDDTDFDKIIQREFTCYGMSYRMTLIDKKDGR